MNNTNDLVGSTTGLSTLQRARFGPGMLLQHEDLEQLNSYTRELSRLLFRSFFGCGVVCGLEVSGKADCGKLKVTVQKGLALSCSGDPVYVPDAKSVYTDADKFNVESVDTDQKVWVVLCGTTKCCAPRKTTCCTDDDEATSDCTREKDGFEIRLLKQRPECGCGCPDPPTNNPPKLTDTDCRCVHKDDMQCHEDYYEGVCDCDCGSGSGCDCILLARLDKPNDPKDDWKTVHSIRRFIRPIRMRDPKVWNEQNPPDAATGTTQSRRKTRKAQP